MSISNKGKPAVDKHLINVSNMSIPKKAELIAKRHPIDVSNMSDNQIADFVVDCLSEDIWRSVALDIGGKFHRGFIGDVNVSIHKYPKSPEDIEEAIIKEAPFVAAQYKKRYLMLKNEIYRVYKRKREMDAISREVKFL